MSYYMHFFIFIQKKNLFRCTYSVSTYFNRSNDLNLSYSTGEPDLLRWWTPLPRPLPPPATLRSDGLKCTWLVCMVNLTCSGDDPDLTSSYPDLVSRGSWLDQQGTLTWSVRSPDLISRWFWSNQQVVLICSATDPDWSAGDSDLISKWSWPDQQMIRTWSGYNPELISRLSWLE